MSRRALAVVKRVAVALVALLLGWLFDWSSTAGLVMLAVAVIALILAIMRVAFGGLPVLLSWLIRYHNAEIRLRELGDIVGEHHDDMLWAGLAVRQPLRQRNWRGKLLMRPMPRPDLVPKMRHRPYSDGIIVRLEAVRAGMSQEEILQALPRLRSAWGVDLVTAEPQPGGRVVEFTIPTTEHGRQEMEFEQRQADPPIEPQRTSPPARPPDAPPAQVVQGQDPEVALSTSGEPVHPPTFRPLPRPRQGHLELDPVPTEAARTFAPAPVEPDDRGGTAHNLPTDEIPVLQRASSRVVSAEASDPGGTRAPADDWGDDNPTKIDERKLRLGAQWRTGSHR
ncbi:MAG: hypothetical protein ACK5H2_01080 [Beutenbergiaceae bacterium]